MTASSRARAAVAGRVLARDPISLDDVLRTAELQTRVDAKYLLTPEQLVTLDADLGGRFLALEIDRRRVFGYDSVYFDTTDLATFRAHRQGRRLRFKARTRTYTDSGDSLFEVKLEGRRGNTVKERRPRTPEADGALQPAEHRFLDQVLHDNGLGPAGPLAAVLRTTYRRATLVDPDEGARLTLDVDLRFTAPDRQRTGPDRVIVESKSHRGGAADRALAARGIRPVGLSKYCVGIALTHTGVAANRWNRILRQEFGWARS